jgi:hypothetical protein
LNLLNAHSTVSQYASIAAGGDVKVTATGKNTAKNTVTTASYADGTAGITLGFNFSVADAQAYVDGTITSGDPAGIGNGIKGKVSLTFNPFTSVRGSNDATAPNTIDFGVTDPGLKTGDRITYDSGLGGAVDGLTSGEEYYVIDASAGATHRIKFALTRKDALAGTNVVVLGANPTLTDTATQKTLPFTQVDETLTYPFDPTTDLTNNPIHFPKPHGFTAGQAVTYSPTGAPLTGLISGKTYYVIVVNTQTVGLTDTYAKATAANPILLPITGAGASITQALVPQTPIRFNFAPCLTLITLRYTLYYNNSNRHYNAPSGVKQGVLRHFRTVCIVLRNSIVRG